MPKDINQIIEDLDRSAMRVRANFAGFELIMNALGITGPLRHVFTNVRKRLLVPREDGLDSYAVHITEYSARHIAGVFNTHDGQYELTIRKL